MTLTLHGHTQCQSAQAYAETQAWQRVCLSHRTTKRTGKLTDEENTEPVTAVLRYYGVVLDQGTVWLTNSRLVTLFELSKITLVNT